MRISDWSSDVCSSDLITDRKSMEIQLKEANAAIEEKNRQIRIALDNISQGLTMYDSENRLVLFNRRYAELYGLGDTLRVGTTLQAMLRASAAVGNYLAEDAEAITRRRLDAAAARSEEHTSELQSLMRISYAVFCLKTKQNQLH